MKEAPVSWQPVTTALQIVSLICTLAPFFVIQCLVYVVLSHFGLFAAPRDFFRLSVTQQAGGASAEFGHLNGAKIK